ncbi:MAG: sulfate ABC transporter ATP-binding protein [Lautropia sp.]|nr:sulfate ABC transporter ATP-binding protein [Lautropia sp.]
MGIRVEHLYKRFGQTVVCDDVSLNIPSGSLVALLGPSGSGKTSLLRILAGLETPDRGRVLIDGRDTTLADPRSRGVGFVFQHYALFNHMTVFENVAFGLRVMPLRQRPAASEVERRVQDLLQLVQLEYLAGRYPSQLSGGQRQRVALARALAVQPRMLLLDEPFGALDAQVRKDLRRWLRRMHDDMHVTSVFVTHDQEEAMEVADQVVVLHRGRVEQMGPPDEVYDRPATPFVLKFLGDVNLFRGHFDAVQTEGDPERTGTVQRDDRDVAVYVRPHEIDVVDGPGEGTLAVAFSQALTVGPRTRLELRRPDDGTFIDVELPREAWLQLRQRQHIVRGSILHVRARQQTRFEAGAQWTRDEACLPVDPAVMI